MDKVERKGENETHSAWVEAHYEEVFCLFEGLASKDYDCFRTVTDWVRWQIG